MDFANFETIDIQLLHGLILNWDNEEQFQLVVRTRELRIASPVLSLLGHAASPIILPTSGEALSGTEASLSSYRL